MILEALAPVGLASRVRVARDGAEATSLFDAIDADETLAPPDVVLLDLNLPKKSGDEVLQHLRASKRCGEALVVIVSSSDARADRVAVERLFISGYFLKSSDYDEFMKLGAIVKGLWDGRGRGDGGQE